MSTQDDIFMEAPDNQVAVTVRAMMSAVTDLCAMASEGIGYELIRQDIDDLELTHARLGQLLDSLHAVRRAAQ